MMVNGKTDEIVQVDVPHPVSNCQMDMKITGPAIATAPDGAVWCALLGANGCLVRVDPSTKERTLYEISTENIDWIKKQRIIHLAFHTIKSTWFAWRPTKDDPYKVRACVRACVRVRVCVCVCVLPKTHQLIKHTNLPTLPNSPIDPSPL